MLKNFWLLSLFLCLSIIANAQTPENLKLRETELLYYEKAPSDFRYEKDIPLEEAQALDKKLRVFGKESTPMIYKAPSNEGNSYLAAAFDSKTQQRRWMLYQKNGEAFIQLYQSPVFRGGYELDLKLFEGENRSLILAEKREGVGDYIDTEVFELTNGRVKYLGNIPGGLIDSTDSVDSFVGNAEVSYQSGIYRIKITGKCYIPAGPRSPYKNTLIGNNVTYIYDGKRLRKGK